MFCSSSGILKKVAYILVSPVEACEYFIKTYTNSGDLVFDSCAGSCITAVAALNTGRNYICFEKDKDIFEVGNNRIQNSVH